MQSLTIYTHNYQKELTALLEQNADYVIVKREKRGQFTAIELLYPVFDASGFATLLEQIIMRENTIVRRSPKLAGCMPRLMHPSVRRQAEQELLQFIKENRELNLEGYTRFRMWEYTYHLHILLYSIVKKLKLPVL